MPQNYPAVITAAFFQKNGAPATGLVPSICIYQVTSTVGSPQGDTLVIGTEGGSPIVPMTELGKGLYKYVFSGYDSEINYAYFIDGSISGVGPTLGNGRYAVGTNENFAEDIAHGVWEEPKNLHLTGSPITMGATVNNIDNSIENLVTCLFGSPKAPQGSPFTPLSVTNIVSGVWNELLAGSPAPYPTGAAGGLINQIAQSAGLTPAQVTAAVWDVSAADYPSTGSPTTMGTQLSLTTQNTINLIDFAELLVAAEYNRTFLDKTAATLTIYASDGTTPLRVFSLRDSGGVPSITEICERLPIAGSPLTIPLPSV
jgi:hypothetical protein